jgi:hypothetical protein
MTLAENSVRTILLNHGNSNANGSGEDMSRLSIITAMLVVAAAGAAHAQGKAGKGIRLWNLTTATISSFQLSAAGQNKWSANLTLADKDKEVDHDERLRIAGIEPGRYDAKVGYPDGRQCLVRDIEIKPDAVFDVADKDLQECNK